MKINPPVWASTITVQHYQFHQRSRLGGCYLIGDQCWTLAYSDIVCLLLTIKSTPWPFLRASQLVVYQPTHSPKVSAQPRIYWLYPNHLAIVASLYAYFWFDYFTASTKFVNCAAQSLYIFTTIAKCLGAATRISSPTAICALGSGLHGSVRLLSSSGLTANGIVQADKVNVSATGRIRR